MKIFPRIGRSSRCAPAEHAACRAIGVLLLGVAAAVAAQAPPDPQKLGPYPVGVTTLLLHDAARIDAELQGPRPLLTEIWYPAADDARGLPPSKFSEFILRGVVPGSIEATEQAFDSYKKGFKIAEFDKVYKNIAVRDARVRDGKFPLIVFSHGNGGTRFGYTYFVEHMASHGYIVMACDHTGNSRLTLADGKVIKSGGDRNQASASDRPKDMSFLIDAMANMNAGGDGRFAGRVDLDKVGAAGMSYGGWTTFRVVDAEPRVKAAVMLAPGGPAGNRTNFTTPILAMIGTEDRTVREAGNARTRQYFEDSKGPRHLVEIKDAGHFTFTSVDQYNAEYGDGIGHGERITKPGEQVTYLATEESHRIINAYATAFWGVHLKGEKGYTEFLSKDHYGDMIIYKH
jgi:dienelactone hydrolase